MKWKKTISFFLAVSLTIPGIIGGLGTMPVQASNSGAVSVMFDSGELVPSSGSSLDDTARPKSDESRYVYQMFTDNVETVFADGVIENEGENGFTIDYAKFGETVENTSASCLVYPKDNASYTDSVLEFDLSVSGEDHANGPWYRVGIMTRFQDGKNCEGIALAKVNSFERHTLTDGNVSWDNVANQGNITFEYGKVYHIKMVTKESDMSLYVDGKLTAVYPSARVASGGYAFRIWGGDGAAKAGKKVTFANLQFSEYAETVLGDIQKTVDESEWGAADILIPVTLAPGDSLKEIKNGEMVLTADEDYTFVNDTIVLKKEYIKKQSGTFSLAISFTSGANAMFQVVQELGYFSRTWDLTQDGTLEQWNKISGNGTAVQTEQGLHIKGDAVLVNEDSVPLTNGETEYVFHANNDYAQFGMVFRANGGVWQSIYNSESAPQGHPFSWWDFYSNSNYTGTRHQDGTQTLMRGDYDFVLKVRYVDDIVSVWMDGQCMFTKPLAAMKTTAGRIGFQTGENADVVLKKVTQTSIRPLEISQSDETLELNKDSFSVTLAQDFPRVIGYSLNGKTMDGAPTARNYVSINGSDFPAAASLGEHTTEKAVYHVTATMDGGETVTFDTTFQALEGNILDMRISNIDDSEYTVYAIGFPEQPLISAKTGQLAASMGNTDQYLDLNKTEVARADTYCTIPIITNGALSASMANNVIRNLMEFTYRSVENSDGTYNTGFWNSEFYYKGLDGKRILPNEDLYCQVILTEDTNEDGGIDWQDGANALKLLVGDKILGAEQIRNSMLHIGYNFASAVQHPFLKVADNTKRLSNLIDGFDQILLFKGYANEGHDSGHSDYDNFNQRAGGLEDMKIMAAEMEKINSIFGVHINASESYPEAKMFNDELISTKNAWAWLDQARFIRRDVDVTSGYLDTRLDSMFDKADGSIGFVYVDTYREGRFAAAELARNIVEEHQTIMATEEGDKLDRWVAWVHHPTISDGIHRFVYHQYKDIYTGSAMYRGGYNRGGNSGFMSWQHTNNIYDTVKQFYMDQLPQRYLMNHDVRKVAGGTAYFTENVHSSNYDIYKDDALIADRNAVFVPWYDEDSTACSPDEAAKIYHWNSQGGTRIWELPTRWKSLSSVKLYQTTQNGKQLVMEVPVADGKITLDVKANTPYVVYPGNTAVEPDETVWSVGSPIEDTSFNSRDFSIWKPDSESGETGHITFADDNDGISTLTIKGTQDGNVSQTIKGLVPGQKYRVSIWAGAMNGKTAAITVITPEGDVYSNYTDNTPMLCALSDNYTYGKRVQRIWVDFTPKSETAQITLSAAASGENGQVQFTEARIVKTTAPDLQGNCVAYEDFEHVDQAFGIFTPESRDWYGHLSELHEGYTNDTINGSWSAKLRANYRTQPSTLRLQSNTKYTMSLKALGSGRVQVFSETSKNDKVLNAVVSQGNNSYEFTTGDKTDYVVRIGSNLIIDDFAVHCLKDDTPPTPPTGLKAEHGENTQILLSWNASEDVDSGVKGYQVYRDGTMIATVSGTVYTDTGAAELTDVEYYVLALNGAGTKSEASNIAAITVNADRAAPFVTDVQMLNANTLRLYFSEPVEQASVQTLGNYYFEEGIRAQRAVLSENGMQLTLAVEGLPLDYAFTFYVGDIADRAQAHNLCAKQTVSASAMIRYYQYEESENTTVRDLTGNEDAQKYGVFDVAVGKNGDAVSLNGAGGIQMSTAPMDRVENWTMETRFKLNGWTGASQTLFSNILSGVKTNGIWVYINNGSKKICVSPEGDYGGHYFEGSETVELDTWYHVALVKDGNSMRLYLNGDEIGHAAAEASNTTTSANPLRLGLNTNVNGDKLHGMNGLMDEFKFYCVPLGAEQIKAEAQQTEYLPIAGGKLLAYDKALGGALEIMMLYNGFMLKGVSVGKNGLGEDDFETGFNVLTLAEKYMNSLTAGTYPVVLTLVKGDIIQTLTLSLQVFGTISEPVHDFSRELLTAVYNAYIGMDTSAYTKASTDALKTALSKANEMMQKEDASESEMQRAAANVMKAAAALEMDTTDLEETIEAAKAAAAAAQKVADEAIKAASANAAAASDAKKLAEEAKKAAEEASAAAEKAAQEASKKAEAAQKAADEAKAKYEEEAEKSAAARTEMERLKEQAAEAQRMAEAAQRVAEEARKAAQNTVIRTEFMSARVSLRSVKNSQKRSARVLWRRVKGAEGYVIQYASNSKFKGVKNVTVKKAGAAQKTIKKLKSGKKYYVRVKAYRMVEGKKIFTKYSYKKSVKIK